MMLFRVLLFLLLPSMLLGQNEFNEAQMAFQAKDYDKAGKILNDLLESEADGWQKSVLKYDYGRVLMAQKKWNAAITNFQSIPVGEPPNPLLESRIFTNIAISLYELGHSYTGPAKGELL